MLDSEIVTIAQVVTLIVFALFALPGRKRRALFAGLALTLTALPAVAETLRVAGHGEEPVTTVRKRDQPAENRRALAAAESAAFADAIRQGVFRVIGGEKRLGPAAERIVADATDHSATFVVGRQVTRSDIRDARAIVELRAELDGAELRQYLESAHDLSLTLAAEERFRVFVLSYTVEGADPDRASPPVLVEDTIDARNDVHARAESSSEQITKSESSRSSHDESNAATSEQKTSVGASGGYENGALGLGASGSIAGSHSASGRSSARVSDSSRASATSDEKNAHESASYDDNSSYYRRFVVYADTTRKGAGRTNEIRAKLEELLKNSGFVTAFTDVGLMDRTFETEDSLYRTVLQSVRSNAEIGPNDFVAVALNRYTPIGTGKRVGAHITYRIIRVRDGQSLLAPKVVTGDSGEQDSEDAARTIATETALLKAQGVLAGEITAGLKQLEREHARAGARATHSYIIRVDNATSPVASRPIKDALRQAGFVASSQFRADARSEAITVELDGRSGDDVARMLEPLLPGFDITRIDSESTVLRVR